MICGILAPPPGIEFTSSALEGGFLTLANIRWIIKKAREFQKNIYFCFIDCTKAFDYVDQTNYGKFLKRWEYQTTWPASWEICMWVKKQWLQLEMEQTGSKSAKEYAKAAYCHPAY